MSTRHTPFSPSGAHRYLKCPGSMIYYTDPIQEDEVSEDAKEGTLAHELADYCYTLQEKAKEGMELSVNFGGGLETKKITDDMADNVNWYLSNINSLNIKKSAISTFEERIKVEYALGIDDEEGILDHSVFLPDSGELYIDDLKYGFNVVSPVDNEQLLIYAYSKAHELIECGHKVKLIYLRIHQPRVSKKIAEFTVSFNELLDKITSYVIPSAKQALEVYNIALNGKAEISKKYFCPGEKQCVFCRGKLSCQPLKEYNEKLLDVEFTDVNSIDNTLIKIKDLSDGELAKRLPALNILSKVIDSLWSEAYKRMINGVNITGYKLVLGKKGKRKWSDEDKAKSKMVSLKIRTKNIFHGEVNSPARMEKILKNQKQKWQELQEFIEQSEAKPIIATIEDKREAYNVKQIEEEFTEISKEDTDLSEFI